MTSWAAQVSRYLESQQALGRSPVHLRVLGYQLRAFARWMQGFRQCWHPERLQPADIECWIRFLRSRPSLRGGPLKPASVNKSIVGTKTFLAWLNREGTVGSATVESAICVKEPRLLPQSVLSHRQMQAFLAKVRPDSCEGLRDRALLEVLYTSGIRVAELLGLDVHDIDLSAATAVVTGKGAKQRVVPLGKTACRHLELYLRGARPRLASGSREHALWLTQSARRLTYASVRRRIAAYASTLHLPFPVTPHTFRRSCTTELVRSCANIWHVKELLGHENLDTLQHYIRLTITDLKKTHARCHPRERDNAL